MPEVCFLLGILHRSGTNFLCHLLMRHPCCQGPGPLHEDFLVHHAVLLRTFAERVYAGLPPKWQVPREIGPPTELMRHLGGGLLRFLRRQAKVSGQNEPRVLLAKTPSVYGIENFFDLFPESPLIVLVRDGRAVVESGVRSFGWDYDHAAKRWAQAADTILKLQAESSGKRLLVLKYEALYLHRRSELRKVFDFLGLDGASYDYGRAETIAVTGSSDQRVGVPADSDEAFHWRLTHPSESFNPLARFQDWDDGRHRRFNALAGQQMLALGYETMHQ